MCRRTCTYAYLHTLYRRCVYACCSLALPYYLFAILTKRVEAATRHGYTHTYRGSPILYSDVLSATRRFIAGVRRGAGTKNPRNRSRGFPARDETNRRGVVLAFWSAQTFPPRLRGTLTSTRRFVNKRSEVSRRLLSNRYFRT